MRAWLIRRFQPLPLVGDTVHFHQPDDKPSLGDQRFHAAMVTRVVSATALDLRVFFADGQVAMRDAVPNKDNRRPGLGHWEPKS